MGVYPRVCGGTGDAFPGIADAAGLSPRVRGNPAPRRRPRRRRRSIPACAGEPGPPNQVSGVLTVYPRVCGGTKVRPVFLDRPSGLSPRVRGNLLQLPRRGVGVGSIPACAGEPGNLRDSIRVLRVYPRVCGGTDPPAMDWTRAAGLSPRVRGNPPYPRSKASSRRSIPACAGEPVDGHP